MLKVVLIVVFVDYQKEHLQFDCLKNVIKKKTKQKLKQVLFEMATNVNGETHICFNCEKGAKQVPQFHPYSKYKSGISCSKSSQLADYKSHRTFCENINTLENQIRDEKPRHVNCCYNHCITPVNILNLAKLVGNRPVLDYALNKKPNQGLWDTGSMISLMKRKWFNQEFPETEIHSIDSVIGTQ